VKGTIDPSVFAVALILLCVGLLWLLGLL